MDNNIIKGLERLVNASYHRPEISREFSERVALEIDENIVKNRTSRNSRGFFQTLMKPAFAAILVLLIIVSIIGPKTVWAQFLKWLSYSPTVGLISNPSSIKILENPIINTENELNIIIPDAILTSDRSRIDYLFFEANNENITPTTFCQNPPYIMVPGNDQRYLEVRRGLFPALPGDTKQVNLYFPCSNGVIEVGLIFRDSQMTLVESQQNTSSELPESGIGGSAEIVQFFSAGDEYILVSNLRLSEKSKKEFHLASVPTIRDADNKLISYDSPDAEFEENPLNNQNKFFNIKLYAYGIHFPIRISFPVRITQGPSKSMYDGNQETWSTSWSPETPQIAEKGKACIDSASLPKLNSLPIAEELNQVRHLSDGSWILVSASGQKELISTNGSLLSISPDKMWAAILTDNQLVIKNIFENKVFTRKNVEAYSLYWSGNSQQLALQTKDSVLVLDRETEILSEIPLNVKNKVIGWNFDFTQLFIAVPEIYGNGYLLREINILKRTYQDVFYLEHSSSKGADIRISPDGFQVAYLGDKQATLYLKNIQNGEIRLLVNAASTLIDPTVISDFFWTTEKGALFIKLKPAQSNQNSELLLNVHDCEANNLRFFDGEIMEVMP